MKIIKQIQKLSVRQLFWLGEAYWRLWPVCLRIKLRQSAWLKAQLQPGVVLQESEAAAPAWQLDMHEAVRLAARLHFFDVQCLPRSLVLSAMLNKRDCVAQVCIGVAKAGEKIASHAWVESGGVMIGEPESVMKDFAIVNAPRP